MTTRSEKNQGTVQTSDRATSVRWALASLSLSMLMSSLDTSIANVGLPTLAQIFGASFQEVQWIVLSYLLAITTLIVSVGRLGDGMGRRRLLLLGIVLFTVASLLCGVSPTLPLLIAARTLQGIGAAIMMALTVALVGEIVPKSKTGSAMGLLGTMSAIGTTLGPSLGGILIDALGWRTIFLVNVPLGILNVVLVYRCLPADRREAKATTSGFDKIGTLLLALTLAAYALAMTLGHGTFGPVNLGLLLLAAFGVGLFVLAERKSPSPLVRLAMFRNPVLSASLAMSALVSTVMMSTLVVGPFYLSQALGLETARVGLAMSVGPLVAALSGIPAGRSVDRFGPQRMTIFGLFGIAVGSSVLAMLPVGFGTAGYLTLIAVITASYALFQTANKTLIMTDVSSENRGVISGMLSLSRNLGLITGTSVTGAVFVVASATTDVTRGHPEAIANGMRITFAFAAGLIVMALAIAAKSRALAARATAVKASCSVVAILIFGFTYSDVAHGATTMPMVPDRAMSSKGVRSNAPGTEAPTPSDPYPLIAAGWGPQVGNGLFVSRWAEDWTGMGALGNAPALKAIPLGGAASLTLSAETRLRYDAFHNAQLKRGNDYEQGLFRGILGADLRLDPHFRFYGEIGTGQVVGQRNEAPANFQNNASLQQLFVDTRGFVGSTLVGAMIGRQEFADGPRQLLSLGDGSNIHRSWNGVRLYVHDEKFRLGAFDLRATQQESEYFDEEIDHAQRLQGLNASIIISSDAKGPSMYLDPFWIHSENPEFVSGDHIGLDDRDTYGARLWGRRGGLSFDWTLAYQTGEYMDRNIDAWGLFAVQSLMLSDKGWKPRLTSHIDVASGGGSYGTGTLKGFNQLYASSNYLGDGRFLSTSNLLLVAPGISVSPTPETNLSIEYGFARRLTEHDAVYGGGMRAYPGTQNVPGHQIGGLLRVAGTWSATEELSFFFDFEHLDAGDVLERAGQHSGGYFNVGATIRY